MSEVLIYRDRNGDQWVVDDSVEFGEADAKYLGVRIGLGLGYSPGGGPRYRIHASAESYAWAIANGIAEAYRPEGLPP